MCFSVINTYLCEKLESIIIILSQIMNEVVAKQTRPIIPDECNSNIRKIIEESWNQKSSNRPTTIQILAKLELLQIITSN